MKSRKNRMKGGTDPFAKTPPIPPPTDENSIRKWFPNYKIEYHDIYSTYFTKPPQFLSMLPKKIKEALLKKDPNFADADNVSQMLVGEIKDALTAKKTADDQEAASQPLEEETIKKLNTAYLQSKKDITQKDQPEDYFQDRLRRSLSMTYQVSNKILQDRYIEAAKNYIEEKPVEEETVVDLTQQKFEKLFKIVNCNPSCLGREREINILADGMVSYQNKLVRINEEILKTPAPTEKSDIESYNNTIASAEKFIEDQRKNPLEFTQDEVKAFIAGLKSGALKEIYPTISSQCDAKAPETQKSEDSKKSKEEQEDSEKSKEEQEDSKKSKEEQKDSTKSKKEARGETEKKSQLFLDGTPRTPEDMQKLVQNFKYSNLRDLLTSVVFKMKSDEKTDRSKEKEFLITLMRKKYFEEKQTELLKLIKILNKTEQLTAVDQIAQTSGKKMFEELKQTMTEETFLGDLKTIYRGVDVELQKFDAINKKKELENQNVQAIEDNRKLKFARKTEYIHGFLSRNGAAEEFIANVNKSGVNATKDFDFNQAFPTESKEEFWDKVFGLKWKPVSKTAPRPVKEHFRVKFEKLPEPWAIELNKELNHFKQNEEGSFINNYGTVVDVLGNPIELNGGYRKSKKRSRLSKNKTRRKLSSKKFRRRAIIK